jgi:hypothetical protein
MDRLAIGANSGNDYLAMLIDQRLWLVGGRGAALCGQPEGFSCVVYPECDVLDAVSTA